MCLKGTIDGSKQQTSASVQSRQGHALDWSCPMRDLPCNRRTTKGIAISNAKPHCVCEGALLRLGHMETSRSHLIISMTSGQIAITCQPKMPDPPRNKPTLWVLTPPFSSQISDKPTQPTTNNLNESCSPWCIHTRLQAALLITSFPSPGCMRLSETTP